MSHKQIHDVQELKQHINKLVKLSTVDGQFFEGILGHVDEQNIHIVVPISIGNNHIGNIGNDHVGDIEQEHHHSANEAAGRGDDSSYNPSDVRGYGTPAGGGYQSYYGGGYPPQAYRSAISNGTQNAYTNPYYNYPPQGSAWDTRSNPIINYYGYLTLPTASLSEVTETNL